MKLLKKIFYALKNVLMKKLKIKRNILSHSMNLINNNIIDILSSLIYLLSIFLSKKY
jgi:hypothetical protein